MGGRRVTGFWWGNLSQRDDLEELGLDGKNNIKICFQGLGCGCMDRIAVAQDRDECWALVNAVMNLRLP
jgi:hypothetical protein